MVIKKYENEWALKELLLPTLNFTFAFYEEQCAVGLNSYSCFNKIFIKRFELKTRALMLELKIENLVFY